MRLIRLFCRNKLACSDRALIFDRSEKYDVITLNGVGDLGIKADGFCHAEGIHEINGRTILHTIEKNKREFRDPFTRFIRIKNANGAQADKTFFESTVESAFKR